MKIILNAPKLKKVLGNVFSIVNQSTVLIILESVLVKVKDNKISFRATDLETDIIYTEDCDCLGEVEFCINAKSFLYFLRNAIEDKCIVDVTDKFIKLSSGEFSVKIQNSFFKVNDFPVAIEMEEAKLLVINPIEFVEKVTTALRFTSFDDLRPSMTGVYIHEVKGELRIASTDAHMLYHDSFKSIALPDKFGSHILPRRSAILACRVFKSGKNLDVSVNDNCVKLSDSNYSIKCRTIDARYPNYSTIIIGYDLTFYMKRKQLLAFLNIATGYVNKSTGLVELEVGKDSVKVTGSDYDESELEYAMPIYNKSKDVDTFSFGVDVNKLKLIIASSKDEYVNMNHSTSPTKSINIDDKFLLMPLMVNN